MKEKTINDKKFEDLMRDKDKQLKKSEEEAAALKEEIKKMKEQ